MLIVLAGVAVSPIAFNPFGSVRSCRKIGSAMVIECPLPALVLSRRDDDHLADRLERLGDRGKTGRPDAVVIADQDAVRAGPLRPRRDDEDERQQRGAKNEKATLHAESVAQNLRWERGETDLTFGRLRRRRNLVQHETAPTSSIATRSALCG